MTKPIRTTDATLQRVQDTSRPLRRIDPAQVQQTLGAEVAPARLAKTLAPLTRYALREKFDGADLQHDSCESETGVPRQPGGNA
jgi:hypothetical protein